MKNSLICLLCSSLCLASLEQEYTEDTAKCVETAKAKHVDNPNAGLDHFVNCILAQLQSIPEDNDSELKEVKTTLKDFEKLDYDEIVHNLVRRAAEEDMDDAVEARGWKNKDKKKKKKKKKQRLEELLGKLDADDDDEDEYDAETETDPEVSEEEADEEEAVESESESPADKNVVQFSVYSGQPRPAYSAPQSDKKKYLFSVDYQGNAHYINEQEVSALLRNPQAMKAMMNYLGSSSGKVEAQARPDVGYRVPENRLYRPPPPPAPHKVYNRRPPPPPKGLPPRLEYFGPKDYRPESAFLIPQSKIRLGGEERDEGPAREKLEPKPRSLARRSANSQHRQGKMGVIHLFRKSKDDETQANARTPVTKISPAARKKKPRAENRKKPRKSPSEEKCKKCENPKIAKKNSAMCKKCKKEKTDCKRCKNEKFRKTHSECKSCAQATLTETPASSQTSERSLILQKKKCRGKSYKKQNPELCRKALDKCNSRMFRTTHQKQCKLRAGDTEWLTQKCSTKVFVGKNAKLCQSLKKSVPEVSSFSLNDLVIKCQKSSFKKANRKKCKVVETLDATVEEVNAKDEEMKEEEEEGTVINKIEEDSKIDAPSKQKADIVESIMKQTDPAKLKDDEKKNQKKKNNKDTKAKKDKSKTKEKKDKIKEKKEKKEKKKEKKVKKEKKEKSKCNKPKYASTHPEECKSITRLDNIFLEKCKKEKYRLKHNARCKTVMESGGQETVAEAVLERLMDVRCRKEAFRKSYPKLCSLDKFEDDILETTTINPAWLRERCKHKKFKTRNKELCDKIRDYELDVDSPESLIDNVINDIKNIVSHETIPPIADNPLKESSTPSTSSTSSSSPTSTTPSTPSSSDGMTSITTGDQNIEADTTPPSTTPTTTVKTQT